MPQRNNVFSEISESFDFSLSGGTFSSPYLIKFFKEAGLDSITGHFDAVFHTVRKETKKMVDVINNNSGWTVIGWHRLGEITEQQSGEKMLSTTTEGHLTKLCPTDINDLSKPEFTRLVIDTPAR